LGAIKRLEIAETVGLKGLVGQRVLAMNAARILDPQSNRAPARGLSAASPWMAEVSRQLGFGTSIDDDDLSSAMGALADRQPGIEHTLAGRHLRVSLLLPRIPPAPK
jgi:hypothetical protein